MRDGILQYRSIAETGNRFHLGNHGVVLHIKICIILVGRLLDGDVFFRISNIKR